MTEEERKENEDLVRKYPFIADPDDPDGYTWLDGMPDGWLKAFGEKMCEELRDALVSDGMLERYRVFQVKEKFGGLRWYDSGGTGKTEKIIEKYVKLSYRTCVNCGDPAEYMSTGYILPFCGRCAREEESRFMPRFIPIDEYLKGDV